MYKQCQTQRSADRQREMEQGLLRVMQRRHYDEISVSDLCEELGIPRKSFYRYFASKDGALYALIDHALMDYDVHTTRPEFHDYVTPMQFMTEVYAYWIGQKSLLDALKKSGLSGMLVQRAMEFTKDLDTIPQFMQITDRRLREYGTMFMVCGLMTMIVRWHHDGFSKTAGEMAELSMELFSKPLFSISPEKE